MFKLHVVLQSFNPLPLPPPPQLCIILFSLLGFTTVWPRVVFFLNDNESNWKYWLAVQLSCQHNHLICQEDLLNCQKSYKKNSFSHWWYTLEMFMNQMGHFWDKCWRKILKWLCPDFFKVRLKKHTQQILGWQTHSVEYLDLILLVFQQHP